MRPFFCKESYCGEHLSFLWIWRTLSLYNPNNDSYTTPLENLMLNIRSLSAIVLTLVSCTLLVGTSKKEPQKSRYTPCNELGKGKATIFIHGTVFPIISRVFHHHNVKRRGLYKYKENPNRYPHRKKTSRKCIAQCSPQKNFLPVLFINITGQEKLSFQDRKKGCRGTLFPHQKSHR